VVPGSAHAEAQEVAHAATVEAPPSLAIVVAHSLTTDVAQEATTDAAQEATTDAAQEATTDAAQEVTTGTPHAVATEEALSAAPEDHSQASAMCSQRSITEYIHGAPPPSGGTVVHKVSTDQIAVSMMQAVVKTVLLGDENWRNFSLFDNSDIFIYIFSGKITALRTIFDKIKTSNKISKIDQLIICISSNNFISSTSLGSLSNIFKCLNDKFLNTKIFICLAGICSSLTTENTLLLEAVNSSLREKSNKCIIINPPENFSTFNGITFTIETKNEFFKCLNSFLA